MKETKKGRYVSRRHISYWLGMPGKGVALHGQAKGRLAIFVGLRTFACMLIDAGNNPFKKGTSLHSIILFLMAIKIT